MHVSIWRYQPGGIHPEVCITYPSNEHTQQSTPRLLMCCFFTNSLFSSPSSSFIKRIRKRFLIKHIAALALCLSLMMVRQTIITTLYVNGFEGVQQHPYPCVM